MKTTHNIFLREIEFMQAKQKGLVMVGPEIKIFHRFCSDPFLCRPGEEVVQVILSNEDQDHVLPLSTATLQVFDYVAKHRFGLTAGQIATGMRSDPFYIKHGGNGDTGRSAVRKFSHSSIKEYVKRIRKALDRTTCEAGLSVRGSDILVSEDTVSNQVRYRLRAHCEWMHVEFTPTAIAWRSTLTIG